jgi:hypothetical protein
MRDFVRFENSQNCISASFIVEEQSFDRPPFEGRKVLFIDQAIYVTEEPLLFPVDWSTSNLSPDQGEGSTVGTRKQVSNSLSRAVARFR